MVYSLIVQFKDFIDQESIDSILESVELKRLRWGSGLKADKMFDLPFDAHSEELRRIARSYEFIEYPSSTAKPSKEEVLSTMKRIKNHLSFFEEIYFIQIETSQEPIELFKNY